MNRLMDAAALRRGMQDLLDKGLQLEYVKWQAPVSPAPNTEPVYEFKLTKTVGKYKVDQISKNGDSIYFLLNGAIGMSPWVNAVQSRPILSDN